jgi:hypothetical protein
MDERESALGGNNANDEEMDMIEEKLNALEEQV